MVLNRFLTRVFLLLLCIASKDVWCGAKEATKREAGVGQPLDELEVLQGLSDDLWEQLLAEQPVLRQVLEGERGSLRYNASALGRVVSPTHALPIWPRGVSLRRQKRDRTPNFFPSWSMRSWIASTDIITQCYVCGLNETLLPKSRLCHDMFDSDDGEAYSLRRFFRGICHHYTRYQYYDRIVTRTNYFPPFFYWSGKKNEGTAIHYIGPYSTGCYKRFVDVGPLYTVRGCRGYFWPWRAFKVSYASHRMERLEWVARGHADVCVHSPHASLTPFSRAVSLFVRYHVCVCDGDWCNRARRRPPLALLPLSIIFTVYIEMKAF